MAPDARDPERSSGGDRQLVVLEFEAVVRRRGSGVWVPREPQFTLSTGGGEEPAMLRRVFIFDQI